MNPCFLYFAKDANGRLKIGCSSQPYRRAHEAHLALIYTFRLTCQDFAKSYQRRLEYVLGEHRKDGWFTCAVSRALAALHNIRDQDPWNRMPIKKTDYIRG